MDFLDLYFRKIPGSLYHISIIFNVTDLVWNKIAILIMIGIEIKF